MDEARYSEIRAREEKDDKSKLDIMRGLTWTLGGGVEGYTGNLAPRVNAGPAWGVSVQARPTSVLGIELGYSGAVNEIKSGGAVGVARGADMVRNGGHALATFGLSATQVHPYVLGGIGFNSYQVNAPLSTGFRSDTSGNFPLGAGVRAQWGAFTADFRAFYNVLFENQLALVDVEGPPGGSSLSGGRYTGVLQVGSTF